MGWWGKPIRHDASMQDIKKEIISDYTGKIDGTFEDGSIKKIEHYPEYISLKFGVAYLAVRYRVSKESEEVVSDMVYAAVVLWRYSKKDGELSTKQMDESMGPGYYGATAKLLKLLTPTDSKYALDWRKQCWSKFKKIPREYQI